jgi:hypothetical protein
MPPLPGKAVAELWQGGNLAGRRMDNRAQERPGGLHRKGVRFFVEDEDEFDLEDTLQVQTNLTILGCASRAQYISFGSVIF